MEGTHAVDVLLLTQRSGTSSFPPFLAAYFPSLLFSVTLPHPLSVPYFSKACIISSNKRHFLSLIPIFLSLCLFFVQLFSKILAPFIQFVFICDSSKTERTASEELSLGPT